jgi:Ubiquitin fusion degradation protein UFD1
MSWADVTSVGLPTFQRTCRVYSSAILSLDRPEVAHILERCDKLILPSTWMMTLHEFVANGPMVFEISSSVEKITHAGVLEFSSTSSDLIYSPAWVMHNLYVEDGGEITVKLVGFNQLPRCNFLRLQPTDKTFMASEDNPAAVLEEALRGYTAVTEGDELVVFLNEVAFSFKIIEVRPSNPRKCAILIDADIDLVLEDPDLTEEDVLASVMAQSSDSINVASASKSIRTLGKSKRQKQHILLTPGEPFSDVLDNDFSEFVFTLNFKHSNAGVKISLESLSSSSTNHNSQISQSPSSLSAANISNEILNSWRRKKSIVDENDVELSSSSSSMDEITHSEADLWISHTISKPNSRNFTWCNYSSDKNKEILISANDPNFPIINEMKSFVFYIAVTLFGPGPVNFTINVDPILDAMNQSTRISDTTPATIQDDLIKEESKVCDVCGNHVPIRTFDMHNSFCKRNNIKCNICQQIYRVKTVHAHCSNCKELFKSEQDLQKHNILFHKPFPCELCHMLIKPELYHEHAMKECSYRKEQCMYCGILIALTLRPDHEYSCGGRSVRCEFCEKNVARRNMKRHLAIKHDVGDASVYSEEERAAENFVSPARAVSPPVDLMRATHMLHHDPMFTQNGLDQLLHDFLGIVHGDLDDDDGHDYDEEDDDDDDDDERQNEIQSLPISAEHVSAPTATTSERPSVQATTHVDEILCPSCNFPFTSWDDIQVHLLTDCSNLGTDAHKDLVKTLLNIDL